MDQQDITSGLANDLGSWGPQLGPYFDFTLFFEQIVFDVIPSTLFIICVPYYLWKVCTAPKLAKAGNLFWLKLVSDISSPSF